LENVGVTSATVANKRFEKSKIVYYSVKVTGRVGWYVMNTIIST